MNYGIVGYSGRMGKELSSIFGAAGHELVLRADEAGVSSSAEGVSPRVIVDFSRAEALPTTLRLCEEHGCALVLGTTAIGEEGTRAIRALSASQAVVQSANFGEGLNLLAMILNDYTDALGGWTMEIMEAHHDKKVDAPSGTAKMLMESTGRVCPMHSLRLGNLPGDHTVYFSNGDEVLTFSHHIINRVTFAQGALLAAAFAASAEPGLYSFADVLRKGAKRQMRGAN